MWEYPSWDVPRLGGGMVIALIATLHVLIAHFSVGAGILLPIAEGYARWRNRPVLLEFLHLYSKFILLIGFVLGAVTGVAIWFSISLASTRATSALIHLFVWFWAAEWVFFLIEILSGYAYYSTWDKVSNRVHLSLAWIYAVSAWMSLFLISGILAFMLTPGRWLEDRDIWSAFLNPSFIPTVALRTASSLALGGLAAIAIANLPRHWNREKRTEVINFSAWFLAPLVLMLPFAGWYFMVLPQSARELLGGGAAPMMLFFLFGIAASTLVGLYAWFGLIRRRRYVNLETSLLLLAIAMIATVSMEFVREGIRKPYLIYGYLYSNGLAVTEIEEVNRKGVLASAPWRGLDRGSLERSTQELGKVVFEVQCSQCHVDQGFNDLVPLIRTWSRELLAFNLDRVHELKPFMPPLVGTAEERSALAGYLWDLKEPGQHSTENETDFGHEPDSES
jgi:cytochrome bd-type quinol oxidase subunit 1